MMSEIMLSDFDIFRENSKTIKQLSYDDSNSVYMIQSEIVAIDFDEVKRCYCKRLDHPCTDAYSVDALLQTEGLIAFVEFKNGKVENMNVRWKLYDTLLMFCDITGIKASQLREAGEFVLVYNPERNRSHTPSLTAIESHLAEKGKTELIRFNLDRYEGLYFKNVHTYTPEEFKIYLAQKGIN